MIKLRKIEPSDLPFLYQWENDADAWTAGNTHNPLSQQDLRAYIASTTGDIYRDGQLRLIIVSQGEKAKSQTENELSPTQQNPNPSTSTTIGCIDLFDFDPRNRRAALGMYISPEARGKGVGKEALRLIEQYAFGFLHLRVLYAVISTQNETCTTIFKQAGYLPSSTLPNWTLESDAILWIKSSL